jgi:DNA primase
MPGIDFAEVRSRIGIAQVLELARFEASESMGDQLRGPCPIHGSTSPAGRSFSVNLRKHTFQCFKCRQSGNQLDLGLHLKVAAARSGG